MCDRKLYVIIDEGETKNIKIHTGFIRSRRIK